MSWEDLTAFDDEYFGEARGDGDEEFDCHMGPGGHCGAAGSEQCEFECPFRREQRRSIA